MTNSHIISCIAEVNQLIGYYEKLQDSMKTDLKLMKENFEGIYGSVAGKHFYKAAHNLKKSLKQLQKAINGLYAELEELEKY